MKLFHNSQDLQYRTPFGAVKTDTAVTLRLRAEEEIPQRVWIRLFRNGAEEQIPMSAMGDGWFQGAIEVGETPCLLWYDFMAETEGRSVYYSNSADSLGGVGVMTEYPVANSYQITVYDKEYQTPAWFRGKVMYQIFPDRFYKAEEGGNPAQKQSGYQLHEDWYASPAENRHPFEDGPAYNDFYGGNLKGITEKLPYIKEMGVGVIYLNPIFEAYSNHRYDTGNYKKIDPILGTEEDFRELCQKAEALGIRVILDGVFSHTGADSIYFNKYGTYGEWQGAFRDEGSPYRNWFQFTDYPNYQSWWGCSNLPNVNEMEDSYLNYILKDEDAVIKKWLKAGAAGWRLDVADELPDEFIKILRQEVKKENPNGVIIGEVWEDASNKTAYSKQREYLWGYELDSVMNYPFRDSVLEFLMGGIGAETLNRRMMSQMENYPAETLHSLMNMLGTHDTMRVKSLLGGMAECCGNETLSSQAEDLATKRLMLGVFLQMTFYGVPCIYYGDEVGMQGGKDPYNRGTYPWRKVDLELRDWYQNLANLRNETECLKRGALLPVFAEGEVYVYLRYFKDGKDPFGETGNGFALCGVNAGESAETITVSLPEEVKGKLKELLSGDSVTVKEGCVTVEIPGYSAKIWQ